MKFYGLRVYDLEESIIASGFPMLKKKYTSEEYENEVSNLKSYIFMYGDKIFTWSKLPKEERDKKAEEIRKAMNHIRRACNLGSAKSSSGHDCMLKGVLVSVNIEADQSFWLQWERYHFQDTISSMSTMHCLSKFENIDSMFSEYTDPRAIAICNEYIDIYNENPTPENFHRVIHNCPEGIELCRRVTTNYLQLKTMKNQRESHKMYAWSKDFINLTKSLPYFEELCLKIPRNKN